MVGVPYLLVAGIGLLIYRQTRLVQGSGTRANENGTETSMMRSGAR